MGPVETQIRNFSNAELLLEFGKNSHAIINQLNYANRNVPLNDMYTMLLIEVLRRMGAKAEEIKNELRNNPYLMYQNGEEEVFLIND